MPAQRNGQHFTEGDPRYGYGEYDAETAGGMHGDDTGSMTTEHGRRRRTGPVRNTRRGAHDSGDQAFADPAYADQAYGNPGYTGGGYAEGGYADPAYGAGATQTDSDDARRRRAEVLDRDALRRDDPPYAPGMEPGAAPAAAIGAPTQAIQAGTTSGTAVYTSRRPGLGMLIGIVAAVAEVLLLVVLAHGVFAHGLDVPAIMGGIFGLAGTPLTAIGFYALVCGAAATDPARPGRAWLRTPLAYLPVGLVLLLAAGMAV